MVDSPRVAGRCHNRASSGELEPPKQNSSASSRHLQEDGQNERSSEPSDETESISSRTSPSTSNFAQTRSPPPVVDTDQPSNRSSPFDEGYKNAANCLKPGDSPFMQSFISAGTESLFFSSRRVTPRLRLTTPSQETADFKRGLAARTTTSKPEVIDIGDTDSNELDEFTTAPLDSVQEDCMQDKAIQKQVTISQEIDPQQHKLQKSVAKVDRQHIKEEGTSHANNDASGAAALPSAQKIANNPDVLDIFEEAVDRQIADEKQSTAESVYAARLITLSSSAPFIPPFEEPASPQTSWGINVCKALDSQRTPVVHIDQLAPHPLSIELTRSPTPPEHVQDLQANAAGEVNESTSQDKMALTTRFDQDQHDANDVATAENKVPATASPQQIDDERSASSTTSSTPEMSSRRSIEPTELRESPVDVEQLSLQPGTHESTPTKPKVLVACHWSPENHDHDKRTAEEDKVFMGTPTESPANSSSSPAIEQEGSSNPKLPTIVLSSPSNVSETSLGTRVSMISEHNNVSATDEIDSRLEEFHALLNKELCGFKKNFLQQLDSVLNESTNTWNATRNSIAATIIARPSVNEALSLLESSIKVALADKNNEVLSRIDTTKAESNHHTANVARAIKKHSRELAEGLKHVIFQHIDQRIDELKEHIAIPASPTPDESVQKKLQIEVSVAERGADNLIATPQSIAAVTEQIKSLTISSTKEISEKLDRSSDHARAEQSHNVAVVGTMQRETIDNLQQMMRQSTLQNLAINDLNSTITPLSNLIKGISHDTALIDAKLAKNAAVLTTVTEQAEKLGKTATSFDKIVSDAAVVSRLQKAESAEKLLSKVTQIAETANNGTGITAKVNALQDQMSSMQQQLSQVLEFLTTQDAREIASPEEREPLPLRTFTERRESESGYISAAGSSSSDLPNDSTELPTISTRTTFAFEFQKRKELKFPYPTHLALSELHSVKNLISKSRSVWTTYLTEQGVSSVEIELISIWLPATDIAGRRLVDNDTAYNGWYKAATTGHIIENRPLLEIEFLVREQDGGATSEEPRSKKRKQEEMRRDSESDSEFRFGVWEAGRPTKYV